MRIFFVLFILSMTTTMWLINPSATHVTRGVANVNAIAPIPQINANGITPNTYEYAHAVYLKVVENDNILRGHMSNELLSKGALEASLSRTANLRGYNRYNARASVRSYDQKLFILQERRRLGLQNGIMPLQQTYQSEINRLNHYRGRLQMYEARLPGLDQEGADYRSTVDRIRRLRLAIPKTQTKINNLHAMITSLQQGMFTVTGSPYAALTVANVYTTEPVILPATGAGPNELKLAPPVPGTISGRAGSPEELRRSGTGPIGGDGNLTLPPAPKKIGGDGTGQPELIVDAPPLTTAPAEVEGEPLTATVADPIGEITHTNQ